MKRNAADRHKVSSLFIKSIRGAHLDAVEKWLLSGADPDVSDENGMTGLHIAAVNNLPDIVEALLVYGANPGLRVGNGATPLMMAAWHGNDACVQKLLDHGVIDVHKDNEGLNALHHACFAGSSGSAGILVGSGSSVDATTFCGATNSTK